MKIATPIARSLQADRQEELRDIERAVATGTRDAGRGLKTELRRQVASAGLGQRLANTWRDKHYPNQKLDELRGFGRATERARRSGQRLTTAVMFLLVPQVKLPKRLDVARAAERWSAQLPALIEQQLRAE